MVCRAFQCTGPALFRSIEKWTPTFIIDEADTAIINNDDLKEVINGGWTRGETVIRCDSETNEPRPYSISVRRLSVWSGRELPPATLSRAIIIAMQRKRPDEVTDDFDYIDNESCSAVCVLRSHGSPPTTSRLSLQAKPEVPPAFHNRVRSNWKLLLAIADRTGYGEVARKAAVEIENMAAAAAPALAVQLLSDIRNVFDKLGADRVTTKTLIAELAPKTTKVRGCHTAKAASRSLTGSCPVCCVTSIVVMASGRRTCAPMASLAFKRATSEATSRTTFLPSLPKTAFFAATPLQTNEVKDLDPNFIRYRDPDVADKKKR